MIDSALNQYGAKYQEFISLKFECKYCIYIENVELKR